MNIELQFSPDICPGVGQLDHMATLFLVSLGTSIVLSIVAALMYIPTNNVGGPPFSTPSPAFIICRLFNDGHSDWCEVIPHCFSLKNIYLIFMAASGLSCSTWDLCCGTWDLSLQSAGSSLR